LGRQFLHCPLNNIWILRDLSACVARTRKLEIIKYAALIAKNMDQKLKRGLFLIA
jgi:hypothetical protein